jgi:hypothetical protein
MSAILSEAERAGQCMAIALFGLLWSANQQLAKPLLAAVAPGNVGNRLNVSCELLPVWGVRARDSDP